MTTHTAAIAIVTGLCVAVVVVSVYRLVAAAIAEDKRRLRDTTRRIVTYVLVLLYEEIAIDRYRRLTNKRVQVTGPCTVRLCVPVGDTAVDAEITADASTTTASLAVAAGPRRAGVAPVVVSDLTPAESLCLYVVTRRVLDAATQEDVETEDAHV